MFLQGNWRFIRKDGSLALLKVGFSFGFFWVTFIICEAASVEFLCEIQYDK